MTSPLFGGAQASRRALHRDRPGREGVEAELVSRLTEDLAPEAARRALRRCLDGQLSARAALAQLLLATRSVSAVRELIDEVTARADADSRAGDALVRDRADALTRLVVDNEAACARALGRDAARGGAMPNEGTPRDGASGDSAPGEGAPDEGAYYERVLDGMLIA